MKIAAFKATCPFEIGDRIRDTSDRVHEITDVAAIHYVRTGKVEFRVELDHSGMFVCIERAEHSKRQEAPYKKDSALEMIVDKETDAIFAEFREFIAKRLG